MPIANINGSPNSMLNCANFVEKNFPDRDPVFCPVSGFCTYCGPIKKISCRQISFDILVHLHIKFSRWSGVRFSVRFPVFVLLMVLSKKILCRKISFVILIHLHINFPGSGVRFFVRFPVFVLLMVVSKYSLYKKFIWYF